MKMKNQNLRAIRVLLLTGLSAIALVLLLLSFSDSSHVKTTTHSVLRRALRSINGRQPQNDFNVRVMDRLRQEVILDNGLVRLTFSKPGGDVIGIKYKGIDNLLETDNKADNRGYWDIVWNQPGEKSINIDTLQGTRYKVIRADESGAEISFVRTWSVSFGAKTVPLSIDKRYIVLSNYSGFYTYTILERLQGWPQVDIGQVRIVYKLRHDKFQFMAISDDRQRSMPNMNDRSRGQPLAYPEAVLLTNPTNPRLRGEVDDKYQYSSESKDNRVHGWMSNTDPQIGFWIITPSYEFRTAGPIKQELTSHAGPISLSMFTSAHYAGKEVAMRFEEGEAWKKVYGPISVYLNSISSQQDSTSLWSDAKSMMQEQVAAWPFGFPQSEDFIKSDQRGTLEGQLLYRDRYVSETLVRAGYAYVGLAAPGQAGSWQKESKGYQFWAEADKKGYFSIKNILPGTYSLYAWVPGVIGDYKYEQNINIKPGSQIKLDMLVYEPPRNGPTLWEVGVPDRSAAEFYIPDPYPTLMNQLYSNHAEKFRQYGLWERYVDLYPNKDLVYNVSIGDYRSDWFFAHVTRDVGNDTYQGTTWTVLFELENVTKSSNYTLLLALASATNMELQVRFNDRSSEPAFSTGLIGRDNAIARHGIHGLYWFYSINVPSSLLSHGNNVVYLTQARNTGPFDGLMYDYIRFEGPPQT